MGKRSQYQLTGYVDADTGTSVEDAAEHRDQSVSQFVAEAVRKELQRMALEDDA